MNHAIFAVITAAVLSAGLLNRTALLEGSARSAIQVLQTDTQSAPAFEGKSRFELMNLDNHADPPGYYPEMRLRMTSPGIAHLEVLSAGTQTKISEQTITFAWTGEYPVESPGDFEDVIFKRDKDWPQRIDVVVTLQYPKKDVTSPVVLFGASSFPNEGTGFILCGADPPAQKATSKNPFTFSYWIDDTSDVTATIIRSDTGTAIYSKSLGAQDFGLHRMEWSPEHQAKGDYIVRIDAAPKNPKYRAVTIAEFFNIANDPPQ